MTTKLTYKREDYEAARDSKIWENDSVMSVVKDLVYACTVDEGLEKAHSGISDNAWNELKKLGLIQDIDMGNSEVITRPTQLGSRLMGEKTGHRPYKTNSECFIHNRELLYQIWTHTEEEQATYQTEADLKIEAKEREIKIEKDVISCPDGAFVNQATGVYTFLEIITDRYSDAAIAAKEAFVEAFGGDAQYEPHKI